MRAYLDDKTGELDTIWDRLAMTWAPSAVDANASTTGWAAAWPTYTDPPRMRVPEVG